MFYRENGQFKTSYRADQQLFSIPQDRWAIFAIIAFAYITAGIMWLALAKGEGATVPVAAQPAQ